MPEYTIPAESFKGHIFWTEVGSISGDGIFFSVARTTPFVAAAGRAELQLTRITDVEARGTEAAAVPTFDAERRRPVHHGRERILDLDELTAGAEGRQRVRVRALPHLP